MDNTSEEYKAQRDAIEEELRSLQLLWNAHVTELTNSNNPEPMHPTPALMLLAKAQFNESDHVTTQALGDLGEVLTKRFGLVEIDEELSDSVGQLLITTITYGYHMFVFGQYCSMRGLLHANMTQCLCAEHDLDETLDKILKRHHDG